MAHKKQILITGGSGFLGNKLVEKLYPDNKIRVVARNEGKLIQLQHRFPEIEIYPGDIADPFICRQACKDIGSVFHLAGFKHVGLAEKFVKENLQTNVIGSLNILEESLRGNIETVIATSTDKAALVSGTYGASKLLMERLFSQYEQLNDKCKYRIVRYGNVLYSTGSVLCKWKENVLAGKEVTITDRTATRFFWTVDQAIDLIFNCLEHAKDSSPYCPQMKSIEMGSLLEAMILKYGGGKKIEVKEIGLQKGENKHERILEEGPSSNDVEGFTIPEIMELI